MENKEELQVTVHQEGEAENTSTRYVNTQSFTIRVLDRDNGEIEEHDASLVFEEVVMACDDINDWPRCNIVEIDVDSIEDEKLAEIVKGKIEKWARANGIHIPSKVPTVKV
jgi:hypothetical protein